ncbi:DUF551 domain-containing protein [Citrobacter sp. S5]|uniref:DUF551 domain-containing protein n=1 Tax=Citrobacter sp. S5 TaxID=3351561 RepID=UPI001A18FF3C|nr:DUF551 domain-containing protein [Citrobacter freundii]
MTTNHPAHGPVSLDRLHQISEILSKAAAQSDGGNLGYAMADAVKVIDGAIAAFNAELYVPTVQCWSCREVIEVSAVGDCDGYCPKCDSPIDLDEEPYDAAILQAGNSPVTPDGWIPVSERMPLTPQENCLYEDVEVQVFAGEDVFISHYAIGALPEPWGAWVDTSADITHWMPLAEPPRNK